MKHILLFLPLIISLTAHAKFFDKKDFTVAVGGQVSSLLYKRGIITYEGYQAFPIYSISLFNPNLHLIGSSLFYNVPINGKKFLLRSRIQFDATNDEPLYYTNEEEDDRIRRDKTNEFDSYLEYSFDDGHYLRLQYSKDLVEHHGEFFELHGRLALADFYGSGDNSLIQPGIFAAVGYGDSKHNQYLYGEGAGSTGVTSQEYGIYIASPKAIEVFWPTLKMTWFELVGDARDGAYVEEKSGFSIEALAAFRVF